VIRAFSFLEVILMTIHASLPQGTKSKLGICFMALVAIDCFMHAYQWKRGLIVDFSDIFYNPRLSRVAACAIIPDGLIMHVAVAADARRTGFFKVKV
jgi:hypothetical protein